LPAICWEATELAALADEPDDEVGCGVVPDTTGLEVVGVADVVAISVSCAMLENQLVIAPWFAVQP
jgi:hypothetical protein